jgi:hypothetical protein
VPNRGDNSSVLKHHLLQIVDALRELGLPYMVVGAFALTAWGRPRATLDLDFIIQTREVPENLVHRLSQLGFHFDKAWDEYNPMIRAFQKRYRSGRTAVDVMLSRDEHDAASFSRKKRKRLEGRYIWFPSAEDSLLQKLKAGRPQDFLDAAGIVERMRGKLDSRYLARWATKLGLSSELAHVLAELP